MGLSSVSCFFFLLFSFCFLFFLFPIHCGPALLPFFLLVPLLFDLLHSFLSSLQPSQASQTCCHCWLPPPQFFVLPSALSGFTVLLPLLAAWLLWPSSGSSSSSMPTTLLKKPFQAVLCFQYIIPDFFFCSSQLFAELYCLSRRWSCSCSFLLSIFSALFRLGTFRACSQGGTGFPSLSSALLSFRFFEALSPLMMPLVGP